MSDLGAGLLLMGLGLAFTLDAIRDFRRARTFRHDRDSLTGRLNRLAELRMPPLSAPAAAPVRRRTRRLRGYRLADLVVLAIQSTAAALTYGFGLWLVTR